SGIDFLLSSIGERCTNLTLLSLDHYGEIPSDIGRLVNLQELNLSDNNFSRLDFSLSQLSWLKLLNLTGCVMLKALPELPSSIAILTADRCWRLKVVGDFHTTCKWLCQVSLLDGGFKNWQCKVLLLNGGIIFDGDRLLQSILQDSRSQSSLYLVYAGSECTFQLPENWSYDFCGFLMCTALTDVCIWNTSQWVTMKRAVTNGSTAIDSHNDLVWEEGEYDSSTWVWYVSFGFLRQTSWWNSTYNKVSFSVKTEATKRIREHTDVKSCNGF
ncbi:Toll/interleukin-1 receptor domain-containing protein, partial [Tanacetum coccineum]